MYLALYYSLCFPHWSFVANLICTCCSVEATFLRSNFCVISNRHLLSVICCFFLIGLGKLFSFIIIFIQFHKIRHRTNFVLTYSLNFRSFKKCFHDFFSLFIYAADDRHQQTVSLFVYALVIRNLVLSVSLIYCLLIWIFICKMYTQHTILYICTICSILPANVMSVIMMEFFYISISLSVRM